MDKSNGVSQQINQLGRLLMYLYADHLDRLNRSTDLRGMEFGLNLTLTQLSIGYGVH